MDREEDESDAGAEGMTFEFAATRMHLGRESAEFLDVHLAMEDIHTVSAHARGFVDDSFDRDFLSPKMPETVARDAQADGPGGLSGRCRSGFVLCGRRKAEAGCASGGGEKVAAVHWQRYVVLPAHMARGQNDTH